MGEKRKTTVYFGGTAHEQWTERGLEVTYSGRTAVARRGRGRGSLRAEAPEPRSAPATSRPGTTSSPDATSSPCA